MYSDTEVLERLGNGFLLGLTEEEDGNEVLAGLFEGGVARDDAKFYGGTLPDNWVLIDTQTWDPQAILTAIDSGRIGQVYSITGGTEKAHLALGRNYNRVRQEERQRTDLLRHNLGENVYPCRECGNDLLPDGLLRHECN